MSIKNLFLFACLLAATFLGANNAPSPVASPTPVFPDGGLCNLAAPFAFHIEEVGTTWAKYSWGGSVLQGHRIRTYRASDNALLKTTNVPPGNLTAIVDSLPTGTVIYGIVNAVCTDGSNSTNEAQSAPRSTLILELIVNGVNPTEGSVYCNILSSPASCEFSSNPTVTTTFKIISTKGPYSSRKFGMNYTSTTSPPYHAYFEKNNTDDVSLFDFRCSSGNGPDCTGPNEGQIWYLGGGAPIKIATFSPVYNTQSTKSFLFVSQLNNGFKIESYGEPELRTSAPSRGQVSYSSTPGNIATASPNPFSEVLDVFPAHLAVEQVTLQLFNLSGQKVLDQQFRGGQEQYSLSTPSISPGFYLLRIEADGEVQTLKVVKSE